MTADTLDTRRLQRVLDLELTRDCDNRAVVGGLDRMFIQMVEDGAIPAGHPIRTSLRALTGAGGYRAFSPEERRRWLVDAIGALERGSRSSQPPRPRAGTSHPRPASAPSRLEPDSPVSAIGGVTPGVAKRLATLGIETAGQLAMHFPRRFNDFSTMKKIRELTPSPVPVTVSGEIVNVRQMGFGRRIRGSEAVLSDGSGSIRIVWFNLPYIAKSLNAGDEIVVSGRVRLYRGRLQMENPEHEQLDSDLLHTGRLVPVYPSTQGLAQRTLRRIVKEAVDTIAADLPDAIPAAERDAAGLVPLPDAITAYHYPASTGEAEEARRRLALGEFLAIQAAVLLRRREWQQTTGAPPLELGPLRQTFEASLPFPLTPAQHRVLGEIHADLAREQPMLRLLQGDVGSGKTIVALEALLAAVASGYQAALMAPTEILAEQHARSITALLGGDEHSALEGVMVPAWLGRPIRMLLITGSLTPRQKTQLREDAAHGGADIVVGTHALLEENVQLPRLGLAVIDEQHRFGVMQRAKLRQKTGNPHLLVMTATPIPRTLALTVYGDLEVSTIDELPPGRIPIATAFVAPEERDEAYDVIRERLDAGEQAFVICPLVEESEALDVRSAEEEYERLRTGPFRAYRLALLHGRMPGRQKDEVMTAFARGEHDVLVSTSVVEVGVDIPNATVMVIEGAERFGLSQLHQFRGRVGRSDMQSSCFLFSTDEELTPEAQARLNAMVDYDDGFKLAEVDLEMRGEGEAWGRLQSGANTMLRVARISDRDLLYEARQMASSILERDPGLSARENRHLRRTVDPILARATEAN